MDVRHILDIRIEIAQLVDILRHDSVWHCTHGVPDDAVFLGFYADPSARSIIVTFEHPSFPVWRAHQAMRELVRFTTPTIQDLVERETTRPSIPPISTFTNEGLQYAKEHKSWRTLR